MDTSKTYIKMCEKAEEIQAGHKWEYGDWLIVEHGLFQIGTATFDYDMGDGTKPPIRSELPIATIQKDDLEGSTFTGKLIWLPRQDQLQAMVRGEKHMHLLAYEFAAYFHGTVDPLYQEIGRDNFTVDSDNSMEQMWLAFVMKVKFGKVWIGEEWVKQ